jgi:hypothetical protein
MKLKTIINRGLKANPEAANAIPQGGAAILYTVNDEVFVLKIDMPGKRLEDICDHIRLHGEPRTIASKIA